MEYSPVVGFGVHAGLDDPIQWRFFTHSMRGASR